MRITTKVVDEVVTELAGADVLPLVGLLRNKTNVSEFTLATGLKAEINQTRNSLYRLYEHNLVSFTRKKDKKKGWYIYFWTFNKSRVRDLVKHIRKHKYDRMMERLMREQNNQFFICKNHCMRLDFEQSHDHKFKCPECGMLLNVQNNKRTIENLQEMIVSLKEQLEAAETIEPIRKIESKVKKKVVKKAVKKKTKAKAKKKAKKKIPKKKIKKVAKKKLVKKKITKKKATKKKTKAKAKKKTKKMVKKKTSKKKTKKR